MGATDRVDGVVRTLRDLLKPKLRRVGILLTLLLVKKLLACKDELLIQPVSTSVFF